MEVGHGTGSESAGYRDAHWRGDEDEEAGSWYFQGREECGVYCRGEEEVSRDSLCDLEYAADEG